MFAWAGGQSSSSNDDGPRSRSSGARRTQALDHAVILVVATATSISAPVASGPNGESSFT